MSYIEINSDNFAHEVLGSDIPVLVDFWAPWCQYCLMISDDIEDLADELDGKIKVCKLNCDEVRDIAQRYEVMSIPCILLFKNGEEVDRITGVLSKDEIKAFIEANR